MGDPKNYIRDAYSLGNILFSVVVFLSITGYIFLDRNEQKRRIDELRDDLTSMSQKLGVVSSSTTGPLKNGQKLCRVLKGKAWRDGIIVPKDWAISTCVDYMKKSGGSGYQLGCVYTDGTNLGNEDGSFPSPNCGWQ